MFFLARCRYMLEGFFFFTTFRFHLTSRRPSEFTRLLGDREVFLPSFWACGGNFVSSTTQVQINRYMPYSQRFVPAESPPHSHTSQTSSKYSANFRTTLALRQTFSCLAPRYVIAASRATCQYRNYGTRRNCTPVFEIPRQKCKFQNTGGTSNHKSTIKPSHLFPDFKNPLSNLRQMG